MAKIDPLTDILSEYGAVSKLNDNFDKIKDALDNTVSRDGSGPNAMNADLDMNHKRLYNIQQGDTSGEPVTLGLLVNTVDNLVSTSLEGRLLKGDPGGNIIAVGKFSDIPSLTIAAGTDTIRTSQYNTATTKGKGAAFYRRKRTGEATPTWGSGIWWNTAADGSIWLLNELMPDAFMFGAVADGARDYATLTTTGTDDHQAIQNLIDYCREVAHCPARLRAGSYRIDRGLQMGWGDGYKTMDWLIGDGAAASGWDGAGLSRTNLIATFSNEPIISIQGQLGGRIQGINLYGLYVKQVADGNYGNVTGSITADDTNTATWAPTSLSTNADSRYVPFAGIAVDPRCSAAPSPAYPDVVYPSWSGVTTQYNKTPSSKIEILDCRIQGVIVGVVIQPNTQTGNSDFMTIKGTDIEFCKYGISITNTQMRMLHVENVNYNFVFTTLTNTAHGSQLGRIHGTYLNNHASAVINLFDISVGSQAGPFVADNCYCESTWRIGAVRGGPALFRNCLFDMSSSPAIRGEPPYFLGDPAQAANTVIGGQVTFQNCEIITSNSPFTCMSDDVTFDTMTKIQVATLDNTTTVPIHLAHTYNGLANVVLGANIINPSRPQRIRYNARNLVDGGVAGLTNCSEIVSSGRRDLGLPAHAVAATSTSAVNNNPYYLPQTVRTIAATSISLSGKTLTFTQPDYDKVQIQGGANGDIIVDSSTGTLFSIFNVNTTTGVTKALMLNNYRDLGSGPVPIVTFPTTSRNFKTINCRRFASTSEVSGTLTNGSSTISAFGANVYGANPDAVDFGGLTVGDSILFDFNVDNWFDNRAKVTTLTAGMPGSITMTQNAAASFTKQRLIAFTHQPPANI